MKRFLIICLTCLMASSLTLGCGEDADTGDGSNDQRADVGDDTTDTGDAGSQARTDARTDAEASEDFPRLVSLTVEPATITVVEAGNADNTFSATLTKSGFDGEIIEAELFIQLEDGPRVSEGEPFSLEGDSINFEGIPYTWFSGLSAGQYTIGAKVESDAGEMIQELDLAEVTVTE